MGRTEHFAEVRFATPQTEGAVIAATVTGHDATGLRA
jgi:threonylcarbamoyladenosine tRNA methylthiotransferase MtaB